MKSIHAVIVLAAVLTVTGLVVSQSALALPSPITFQRSVPYTVFNSTDATVYDVTTNTNPPFEISIVNELTYTSGGSNNKAILKFQQAKTGSFNALEIVMYEDKAIDINWSDKVTGTTTKIGGQTAEEADSFPKELLIENTGTTLKITDITNGQAIIENFVLPNDFNIVAVSGYGEASATTDGFATVYIGGINPSKLVTTNTNSMMPLVIAIVSIGLVLGVFAKLTKKI